MHAGVVHGSHLAPSAATAPAVAALFVDRRDRDVLAVAIPRPEVQIVARFGPSTRGGVDVHAMGGRARAHRKLLRRGQRAVTARLHLGAPEAVLGVSAPALAGRIVALEELWGDVATRRLLDKLAAARDLPDAAAILESAIAERRAVARGPGAGARLALAAAQRLAGANVSAVAGDLGVSERHLRRLFRETIGVSPKTYAKLARFHRALGAARQPGHAGWAGIAAQAGYYDQAHLIADFRAIAGVTPQALLGELAAASLG
jgi:AraC-like DNA-binding protein